MNIGRKIYYDLLTGNVIVDTGERSGAVIETTTMQDFASYAALAERTPSTVGVIELEYGQYVEDFAESNGYRVDVATGAIIFSYPDPNESDAPQVFTQPLTERIAEQNARLADVELALIEIFSGGVA
ncbi:hypothetical protein [Paenibacillus harenae]|uniref:Tail fiber domain-containing protein n=1 Tax=Paenibacillus harenae TaxID=306543 RepID=A0ABT9U3X5_PAEHA|nr:hypothetical protein [Paenibacillus harenae]MDQ0114346.1 hypothetical protein [Paenibacillus harenae]